MASSAASVSGSLSETSQGQQVLVQEEHAASDTQKVTGAHTPPTYNGERQVSADLLPCTSLMFNVLQGFSIPCSDWPEGFVQQL